MTYPARKSRVGLAVVKLKVNSVPYFLMRMNPKWKDVNFIGGHDKPRDARSLKRTAQRELWEEVPSIRGVANFTLEALTEETSYGPIYSRSKGDDVEYELQFFLVRINRFPGRFVRAFGPRTRNLWVTQSDLIEQSYYRVSGLVALLDKVFPGGLAAIPYSSNTDLGAYQALFNRQSGDQLELVLNK